MFPRTRLHDPRHMHATLEDGRSAAALPRPNAQALRARRPRLVPLRGVAVAAPAQMSEQIAAAREGLPAGGAAKRDWGAEARGAALVVKQAQVVVGVALRLEGRAADLAVEGLGEVNVRMWHRPLDDWPRPPPGLLSQVHDATAV